MLAATQRLVDRVGNESLTALSPPVPVADPFVAALVRALGDPGMRSALGMGVNRAPTE